MKRVDIEKKMYRNTKVKTFVIYETTLEFFYERRRISLELEMHDRTGIKEMEDITSNELLT